MALILLIDDDAELREVLKEILVMAGHQVLTAANGQVGLELANAHFPNLVITDMLMPEMEGLEMIQQLRAHHANLKIIAMSGAPGDWRVVDMARKLGAMKTVTKPFLPDQILNAVRNAALRV